MTAIKMRTAQFGICAALACWMSTSTPARACVPPQGKNVGSAMASANALMLRVGARPPAVRQSGHTEAATAADAVAPTPVGLWHTVYLSGGVVVDQGFETYHADGTEMIVDLSPPATDNVCSGAWIQTGPATFTLNHPSWVFDPDGNLIGTAVIRDVITVSRDNNAFTGTETVDVYDTNGNLADHFDNTVKGTRIYP